jgi:hypothetical protein
MMVRCTECMGYGLQQVAVAPKRDLPPMAYSEIFPGPTSYETKIAPCPMCGGSGTAEQTARVAVMQDGVQIGTLPPTFEPTKIKSVSWLYQPRDGDFKRDGDAWVANSALGPGDLEAVPGFVWERK